MHAEGVEIVLLGYSASESESIRCVLSPLTEHYGLVFRTIHEVDYLPAASGGMRSCVVVSNDWHGGIDVNRVIERCQQQASKPLLVFVSGNMREEVASHAIDCGADGYLFWDRLFELRWIVDRHLQHWLRPGTSPALTTGSGYLGQRLSSLLDISTDAIIAADSCLNIVFFNKGAERIFGHRAGEIVGQPFSTLVPSFEVDASQFKMACSGMDAFNALSERVEVRALRKDGGAFPAEVSLAVLEEDGGAVCLAILRDIGEKKRAAEQVEYLATHDSLTGLPNRRLFFDRLSHAINVAERNEKLMALMFIDLDGFKQVNDTFGHAAGDELLCVVGERFRSQLRSADTVARLGGDEFAVILENLDHVDPISELADALLRSLSEPIVTAQGAARVSASIGIVICPLEAKSAKEMMVDADRAMYAAKAAGKNCFLFYSLDMSPAPMQLDDDGDALLTIKCMSDRLSGSLALDERCA